MLSTHLVSTRHQLSPTHHLCLYTCFVGTTVRCLRMGLFIGCLLRLLRRRSCRWYLVGIGS